MLVLAAYLALSLLIIFWGYLVSVFSLAVYIAPDEIKTIFPEFSQKRKKHLEQFTSNPRAFFKVALLMRISAAMVLGILSIMVSRKLIAFGLNLPEVVFPAVFLIYWLVTVALFIYLPRQLTPEKARRRLYRFLPLLEFVYRLFTPIMAFFNRYFAPADDTAITEDQKDDIVERAIESLAESAGINGPLIEQDEKEMIHQIFQLDVTEAEEIMVPRINISAFENTADLDHIRDKVRETGYTRYPVYKETIDIIIGIVKVKDLLLLGEEQQRAFKLTDHIREPLRIGEHKKIDQLLAEFKRSKTHMAIVIDEFGGTAGLVTLEDILEEIVGDIEDEDDPAALRDIVPLENGNFEISAALPLEELADHLDIDLDQDEFETVGGLIYDLIGSVPTEGTSLSWNNCRLKVLEVKGQRITRVLIIPPAQP